MSSLHRSNEAAVPGCFSPLQKLFSRKQSPSSTSSSSSSLPPTSSSSSPPEDIKSPFIFSSTFSDDLPVYSSDDKLNDFWYRADVMQTVKDEVASLSSDLRKLNLRIHDNPELGYKEFIAHKTLTEYLSSGKFEGVEITPSFHLETAFKATFSGGKKGKLIGFNSEYDALPGVGHACGHNLIAICGVAAFLGLRKAMIAHSLPGSLILLGTPAEEGPGGKIKLLDAGAYEGMDACLMAHPVAGGEDPASTSPRGVVVPMLAGQSFKAHFLGKTAHAAATPFEGINALDAAVIAYSSVSALRQQIHSEERIHGVIVPPPEGWASNVIPDKSALDYGVRAPTLEALDLLRGRVIKCFEAAALATGCTLTLDLSGVAFADLRNNHSMGDEYVKVMNKLYDYDITFDKGIATGGASTDFGNVSYAMPTLHPAFPIRSQPLMGNHTPGFTAAARKMGAHDEALRTAVGLVGVAVRVLTDEGFKL